MIEATVVGEKLCLLPEGAAFWEDTLLVADVHFGKAAAFRAAAVPVPLGTTRETLCRLDRLVDRTGPSRIIFLGDLWHAKDGRTAGVIEQVREWRVRHSGIEMILVEGNHDLRSGKLPPELDMQEVPERLKVGPFQMCHHPQECEDGYVLAGHIHPAVRLEGRGDQAFKLPCFWFGAGCGVLPAFGEFTGTALVRPRVGDQVFAIADGRVFAPRVFAGK